MSFRDGYQSNNFHSMMIDPNTIHARIYVGNIPTDKMTKQELEERFKKHGAILGVSLNRKFGFIQYERERSAIDAIKAENGALFRGRKMEVNAARIYGKRPPRRESPDSSDSFRERERSPLDDRGRDHTDWRDRDRFDNYPSKPGVERDRANYCGTNRDSGFSKDNSSFGNSQDKFTASTPREDRVGFGKDAPNFVSGRSNITETRNVGPGDTRIPKDAPNPMERTNDCEIIVCNKKQREYAEYIEHWLKQLGLTVDLLFPNEEVPIGRVLASISTRGTLYAIMVMPQNEEHRSLTLNILHGLPQEHRNMPLKDAIPMIERDFKAYVRGEKSSAVSSIPTAVSIAPAASAPAGLSLSDRHPEAIQVLLNLLSDNRQLTVLQYDRVIRYLQDKRELQLKLELGDAKDLSASKEPSSKQQVDLQHRILNILNNSSGTGVPATMASSVLAPVPPPAPVSAPAASSWPLGNKAANAPTPLLNDPTVQKALDSLMQGNLLRKIAPTTTVMTTPTTPSLSAPPNQPLFGAFAGMGRRF